MNWETKKNIDNQNEKDQELNTAFSKAVEAGNYQGFIEALKGENIYAKSEVLSDGCTARYFIYDGQQIDLQGLALKLDAPVRFQYHILMQEVLKADEEKYRQFLQRLQKVQQIEQQKQEREKEQKSREPKSGQSYENNKNHPSKSKKSNEHQDHSEKNKVIQAEEEPSRKEESISYEEESEKPTKQEKRQELESKGLDYWEEHDRRKRDRIQSLKAYDAKLKKEKNQSQNRSL